MHNRYFLLRHGESFCNKRDFLSSWPEKFYFPLTKKGEIQIKKQAKILKKEKIDFIFSSDLLRTRQTAGIMGKGLGLTPKFDKKLRELDFGDLNGSPAIEFKKLFPINEQRFAVRNPNGENWRDAKKRMSGFLKELEKKYKNKKILIISHGDPLWLLCGAIKGLNEKELFRVRNNEDFYPNVGQLLIP